VITVGGMPGWQITLIAVAAALVAATATMLLDRVRAVAGPPSPDDTRWPVPGTSHAWILATVQARSLRQPATRQAPTRVARRQKPRSASLKKQTPKGDQSRISAAVCAFRDAYVSQRDGVAGADVLGSRTLLRPATGNALAGSAATFRGPDRLPKPGSLDDARMAPFRLPRVSRHPVGSRPSRRRPRVPAASGRPGRGSHGAPRSPLRRDTRSALP